MRHQLLPAHRVQVRRVNEAVPHGGIGHQVQVVLCQCVSVCVCSVFVLYRFRAVCAHCVCVLVVCSVRAYLHKDIRFTLTDYALCAVFADFYGENIVYPGGFHTSHTSQGPPSVLIVVTSLPSRLARRPSAHVSLSAGSRYAQLAEDTHSHSSQHAEVPGLHTLTHRRRLQRWLQPNR